MSASHQSAKFLIDDFDYLLCRREGFEDIFTESLFTHSVGKIFDDVVIDVGFQESNADFAHSLFYLKFGQLTFVAKF